MGFRLIKVGHVFTLLCCINMLNYLDRGIIPGAPIQFQAFVQQTHNVSSSHVSVYIGILQSSFIASYSVFICIFGYLSITRKPFILSSIGLFIWVIAIILCGIAKPTQSFYLLLAGRLLSGIGESSFQATTPPFIDEFAPESKRTLWLGIFYAAVSVGQALGFSYGSAMASSIGWDIGYYITAGIMAPMAFACYKFIPDHLNQPLGHHQSKNMEEEFVPHDEEEPNQSVMSATCSILTSPLFLTSTLGLAAYTFTLAGMVSFAPAIIIGYGLLDESIASTVFGALVVVAGLIGSPCGGYAIDLLCRSDPNNKLYRMQRSALFMFAVMTLGVAILFVSLAFMNNKIVFFLLLFLGLLFIFSTQTATTIVVLMSVSNSQRGYAMGLYTLLLHLFGDVPASIVLGALKDYWAPHCGSSIDSTGKDVLDPDCHLDKDGLRYTLTFAYSWLLWAVLLWGLLQSCFIASYSICICIFGYMSMTRKPFLLTAIGMAVWAAAIILCGIAKPTQSFYVLLCGRLISGIGESSFHATAPPFIDEFAPVAKRTLWMGIFFAAVSVGQALGFSYGSLTARTIGWDYGFYFTALIMVPLAYACYKWIPDHWNQPLAKKNELHDDYEDADEVNSPENTAFLAVTWALLKSPVFMCFALGLAAYNFTLAGMVAFAPAILIGYDLLGESIASTVFGGLVVVAGLIGSPCGGLLLDRICRSNVHDRNFRLKKASMLMFVLMGSGVFLLFVSLACMHSRVLFLLFLFFGLLLVFSTQTATTIAILMSVTRSQRAYSMGLNTLLLHLFGDVPSSVILGALKDHWAPNCGSKIDANGKDILDPLCYKDRAGLRYTLSFAYSWLLWSVLLWGIAYIFAPGRLMSGIGESSFHATAPPFIDEFSPPNKRTLWLGLYYATFSIGQAVGFSYGSVTARTIGWDYGFYFTALLMLPVIVMCVKFIPEQFNNPLRKHKTSDEEVILSSPHSNSSFFHETWMIAKNPAFLTSALGLAAFTFTLNGLVAFAPAILIGYGLLGESIASTAFGGIVVIAGLIGAPVSGYVLDRCCRNRQNDRFFRLYRAALQMFGSMTTGVILLLISLAFMNTKIVFLLVMFLGFLFIIATQTVTTIVIMMSVNDSQRGYAVGLSTFIQHLFGDVPAAVILGALKDFWAPHCGSVTDAKGKDILDPNCSKDQDGLRYTLSFAYGWLLWAVVCWGITYMISRKWYRAGQHNETLLTPQYDPPSQEV
ncbi:Major Facilitator Superfamily (MFS) [Thraustotheca clavata]|uniref:Major Facilitator Superfamily (MFS) n=1 Tax=Thraustotheca clavata TaxID=74557 RepID=A0A1V9Y7C9_9STRA|nr:Major Facilitator Superfamily (MFS) [Thraustotheca clavata]